MITRKLNELIHVKENNAWGTWVAQSLKLLISVQGHDLMVAEFESWARLSGESAKPTLDSLSPSLSSPPARTLILSLFLSLSKISEHLNKTEETGWPSPWSVWLQLSSWSCSLWVWASHRALCWQLGAWSLLQILCLPVSLPLPCSCSLSLKSKH